MLETSSVFLTLIKVAQLKLPIARPSLKADEFGEGVFVGALRVAY